MVNLKDKEQTYLRERIRGFKRKNNTYVRKRPWLDDKISEAESCIEILNVSTPSYYDTNEECVKRFDRIISAIRQIEEVPR